MKTKLYLFAAILCCTVSLQAQNCYSGTCGENLTWRINTPNEYEYCYPRENGDTLYIEGYGTMDDYNDAYGTPWRNAQYIYDIKYISLPNGLTHIGKYAFSQMGNESNYLFVEIPNTVSTIGNYAFWYSYIYTLNIPNSVTTIGKYAFHGCHLYSINIPSSVTLIDTGAFRYCWVYDGFNVAADNPNYSSLNGFLCNKEQTIIIQCPVNKFDDNFAISNSIVTIGRYAFAGCELLRNIIIPNSVTTIEDYAFSGCLIQSIDIPNSVISIGKGSLGGQQLNSINVVSDNPNYSSINGVLFNKSQDTLILYPTGRIGTYSIPEGVTTIMESAFSGCSKLTAINFTNNITDIGVGAFYYCSSLVSVVIPDGISIIRSSAFGDCENLSLITIGKNVKTIEYYAFAGSAALREITIPEGVITIGGSAFAGYNLATVTISSTVTNIERGAFLSANLETVYNYAAVPQIVTRDVFCSSSTNQWENEINATLYVTEESVALYQAADVWKEFNPILPLPPAEGLENPSVNLGDTHKFLHNGNVYILTGDKTYTLTGQEIK